MAETEADMFKYISYVTVREAWAEIKTRLLVWLVISVIFVAVGILLEFGVSKTEGIGSAIPKQIWYVIGYAAFTWMVRGQEFTIAFPRSFKLWLISTVGVAGFVLALELLPAWAMIPIYVGIMLGVTALDDLASIGEKNFRKLSGLPAEDDFDEFTEDA